MRREARGAAIARGRQAAAASRNEDEESDETEDEAAGERTTRVRQVTRPRGGMKVAARELARVPRDCAGEIGRGRDTQRKKERKRTTQGRDGRTARRHHRQWKGCP